VIDACIAWLLGHPLEGVAALALLAVAISVIAIPRLHEVTDHGHPRC